MIHDIGSVHVDTRHQIRTSEIVMCDTRLSIHDIDSTCADTSVVIHEIGDGCSATNLMFVRSLEGGAYPEDMRAIFNFLW